MMLKPVSSLVLAAVMAASLAGCGSRVSPTAASIASSKTASAQSVSTATGTTATALDATTPTAGSSQLDATTGTTGLGVTNPSATAPTLADITATVSTKKNGTILGMGTFKCTIEVSNPSSVARYGTVTATFMNGSKQSKTAPVVIPVTLKANETRSYDLSDGAWSTDDVQLEVTTKAYAAQ